MKKFDCFRFVDKCDTAIHVKNKEEYDDFIKQAAMMNGLINNCHFKGDNTCIFWDEDYGLCSDFFNQLKFNGYRILKWSDFMNDESEEAEIKQEIETPNFKLKVGYVVRFTNGQLAIVAPVDGLGTVFVRRCIERTIWASIENHLSEIEAVYGYSYDHANSFSISTKGRELLWEKEKPIMEVTMSDIENKFGCKVKIVEDKK